MKCFLTILGIFSVILLLGITTPSDPLAFPWNFIVFSGMLFALAIFVGYRDYKFKKQNEKYRDDLFEKIEKELNMKLR